jgi:hypothetical protein
LFTLPLFMPENQRVIFGIRKLTRNYDLADLPHSDKDRDNVDSLAEDHPGDSTRYRLSYAIQTGGSYETGVPG